MFQDVGLSELRAGVATNGLRSILSMLTLLMYHLYITVILGKGTKAILGYFIERTQYCQYIQSYFGRQP
jgi:hypothetical protein